MSDISILSSIEDIDDVVMESEIEVLNALWDSYDKAIMVLENYDGDDIESFSIFQEGKILDEAMGKGTNDSTIKKIVWFIPRLITSLFNAIVSKFSKDKQQAVDEAVKEIEEVSAPDENNQGEESKKEKEEETEYLEDLFDAFSKKDLKKAEKILRTGVANGIRKDRRRQFGKKVIMGMLKVGGGAVVVGGTAYWLNSKKELISQKASEYKGKIMKTIEDNITSPIKDAANEASEKIKEVSDAAVQKIQAAVEKVKECMTKAIEFIRKIYDTLKKFFNLSILGYKETNEDGIICKYNMQDGSLTVTLNIDMWKQYVAEAKKFIGGAAEFIGKKYENGQWTNNDSGRREGPIIEAERDASKAKKEFDKNPLNPKNVVSNAVASDGKDVVDSFKKNIDKIASKAEHKAKYTPLSKFEKEAKELIEEVKKLKTDTDSLAEIYQKRIQANDKKDGRTFDVESHVHKAISGVVETLMHIINGIDAVNAYIKSLNDYIKATSVEM